MGSVDPRPARQDTNLHSIDTALVDKLEGNFLTREGVYGDWSEGLGARVAEKSREEVAYV